MAKIPSYPALLASALAVVDQFPLDHGGSTRNMTVTEMNKYWATVQSVATLQEGYNFFEGPTPSATASGQTWLNTVDGYVYKSTGTGTGNWVFQYVDQLGLKDIDQGGAEILRSKTIQDIQPFQYAKFNGTSSFGLIPDNINIKPGANSFSFVLSLIMFDTPSSTQQFLNKLVGGIGFYAAHGSDGKLLIRVDDGVTDAQISSDESVSNLTIGVAVTVDRNGLLSMSIGGVPQADTTTAPTLTVDNVAGMYIGSSAAASNFLNVIIKSIRFYNHIDIDDKGLSSNPNKAIDWPDEGGSNVDLTSGTLTIGKKYRTGTFIAGDDFSNIADTGASANVTGAEWTATGTTPTTWVNSSVLHQLGATLNLKPQDMSPIQAKDSANGLVCSFTDVELGNTALDHVYQDLYQAIADNDTFDVPEGCAFLEILINTKTLQAAQTIRIGTTNGGQEVVADSTAPATVGMKRLTVLIDGFSAGDTLYIGSDGGSGWTTLVADIHVRYQIIKV